MIASKQSILVMKLVYIHILWLTMDDFLQRDTCYILDYFFYLQWNANSFIESIESDFFIFLYFQLLYNF